MTAPGWLDDQRAALAVANLLDAAAVLFAERGVASVAMGDVARAAGCSRATLYRYFPNREALRAAFVDREARRIAAEVGRSVAAVDDPHEQLVAAVVAALAAVRRDRTLMTWFSTDNAGTTVDVAQASAVIARLAAAFLGEPTDPSPSAPSASGAGRTTSPPRRATGPARQAKAAERDTARRSDWLVRSIVSLLLVPAGSAAAERSVIEQFVAPVVLGSANRASPGPVAPRAGRRVARRS